MQGRFFGQEHHGINLQVFWKDYYLTTTRHSSADMERQIAGAQNALVPAGVHGENHLAAICDNQITLWDYPQTLERVRGASNHIPLREGRLVGSGLQLARGIGILGLAGVGLELASGEAILGGFLLAGSGVAIATAVTVIVAGIVGSKYAKEYEGVLQSIQDNLERQDYRGAQAKLETEMYKRSVLVRATRSAFLEKMHYALAHFFDGLIAEGLALQGWRPDGVLLRKAFSEYKTAAKDAEAAGLKARDLLLIIRMQHLRLLQHAMQSDGIRRSDRLYLSQAITDGVKTLEHDFGSTLNMLINRHIAMMLVCRTMMSARQFDPSAVNPEALKLLLEMPSQFIFENMNKSPMGLFMALTSCFFRAQVLGYLGHAEDGQVTIPGSTYKAIEADIFSLRDAGLLPPQSFSDHDSHGNRLCAAADLVVYTMVSINKFREQYPDAARIPLIKNALDYMSHYATGFVLAHSQLLGIDEIGQTLELALRMIESSSQFASQYREHNVRSRERLQDIRRLRLEYGVRFDSHETLIDALFEPGQPRLLGMLGNRREAMVQELGRFPRDTLPDGVEPDAAASLLKECILIDKRRSLIAELQDEFEYKCEPVEDRADMNRLLDKLYRDIDSRSYVPVQSGSTGRTLLHWLTKFNADCASPWNLRRLTKRMIKFCHIRDRRNKTAEMLLVESGDPCGLMPIFNRHRILLKQHTLMDELKNDFEYKYDGEMDFEGVLSLLRDDIGIQVPATLQSAHTGRSLLHWLADFNAECIDPMFVRELTEKLMASRYLRDHENRTAEMLIQQSGDPCALMTVYERHNARPRTPLIDRMDGFVELIRRGGGGREHFMLLEGPPGTGKTTTVINYLRTAHRNTVQVHEWVRGAEADGLRGGLEARIEEFFRRAEQAVHETGKIQMLFIDEIDAICPEVIGHAEAGRGNQRDIVQLFQIRTSALKERSLPIALIGATNYPENIARPMLSRATGNRLVFPLPSHNERLQLLHHELRFSKISSDCINKMASASHGWSHRQLADVCVGLRQSEDIDDRLVQNEFASVIRQFESEFASEHVGAKLCLPLIRMDDIRDPFANLSGVDRILANTFRQLYSWLHTPVSFEDSPRRHMLLHGKPGGGKTYAISKLLENANVPFIRVDKPLSSEEYAKLFSYAGQFDHAVIFIDEIDAIFRIPLVAECLQTRMDGMEHSGVIVMAATNFPQRLPEAIFDRFTTMIRVPPMSMEQKQAFVRENIVSALRSAGLEPAECLREELDTGCFNIAQAAEHLSLRCILSALRIEIENKALDAANDRGDGRVSAADILNHLEATVAARRQALYGDMYEDVPAQRIPQI